MERITAAMLEKKVTRLNLLTGNPPEPYTKRPDGKYVSNIGNYHISGAYGGVALEQMVGTSGGVRSVFSCGYVSKRELYGLINAYIEGVKAGRIKG